MAVPKTNIEWTEATWNPVAGCTKVSPGCAHCYAEALTLRFHRGGRYLPGESTVEPLPAQLEIPLRWKTPRRIFVNSMSDLFHEAITTDYIAQVFDVMEKAHWHTSRSDTAVWPNSLSNSPGQRTCGSVFRSKISSGPTSASHI